RRSRARNCAASCPAPRLPIAPAFGIRKSVVGAKSIAARFIHGAERLTANVDLSAGRRQSRRIWSARQSFALPNLACAEIRQKYFRQANRAVLLLPTLNQRGKQSRQRQARPIQRVRSEEHTSELQSPCNL